MQHLDITDAGDPARPFAEPWQAQAFAMTMHLSQRGAFSWTDWVTVFSTEIRTRPAQPNEDSTAVYYRQWLAALESILTSRRLATGQDIEQFQSLWQQAYLNTPHGEPVALENASPNASGGGHAHGHHHLSAVRQPVAVSPGIQG